MVNQRNRVRAWPQVNPEGEIKMNQKNEADRRKVTVKFRLSQKELTRLEARANLWTKGNISELIRHAIESLRTRPSKK